MSVIEEIPSIDDEFERCNRTLNAKGLSNEDIERRDKETQEMMRMYPGLNPLHADMIWNYVHFTPKDEVRKIIDEGLWEGKPSGIYQNGGIVRDAVTVSDQTKDLPQIKE
tara:strand:+ start:70 stop:399 length:330 start_codon:yes stop_codon:yes gene_type:complete